jgi:TolB-like protein/DNA-binding winged helix-turn-helix (wHTH) protein/Tfp pilus assembly protein PilF
VQATFVFLRNCSGRGKAAILQVSYEFGPFYVDANKRRLLRHGEPVPLAPKVLDTLLVLVDNRDRVLTKDELLKHLWRDTIVEEGGLTRNISILRKTLGEKPDEHQYVVTLPGRGYQFVAEVREVEANLEGLQVGPVPTPPESCSTLRGRPSARKLLFFGGVAILVVAGSITHDRRPLQATKPEIKSRAVLPLNNLSSDPAQEYFTDGMTEALIGNLARIHALRVVSRTSVMRFKGARTSLSDIARALHVDAVIEGSVQHTGDRVRISIQLIHAPTDTHLWAREYERTLMDILKLQSEVAREVAGEIRIQVTAEERSRMASAGTINPAAYQEYLLGQYHLWKLTEEHLAWAVDHFERATHLDPGYAPAHAGLSHAWWWRGIWGAKTLREVRIPSRAAARKALDLDPRLAEAHTSMGRIKYLDWDWAGAEKDFGRALELDPNNLDAQFFYGDLFSALGRFPESIAHMQKAEQLDPLSSTVQSGFGRILYRARRFEEAISHLNRAIELEPQSYGGIAHLADVYEQMGRYTEALALHEKYDALRNRPPGRSPGVARIYTRMGKRKEARQILDTLRTTSGDRLLTELNFNILNLAGLYTALDDKDEAFRLLYKNSEVRDGLDVYMKVDPRLDPLHSDPRWPELLRRMNFP